MINRLSHSTIYVLDQDEAREFYTEKLGLQVRTDLKMDGFRWLTVGSSDQPELELVLVEPGPPMFDAETAAQLKAILTKGALGVGVFSTPDCRSAYEELSRRGVHFLQEPAERPYGIEATFRDNSGNWFSLTQHFGAPSS